MGWLAKLLSPREPGGEIAELIAAYLNEHCEHYWDVQPRKMPSGIKLLALPPAEQARAIKLTLQNELDTGSTEAEWIQRHKREKLVSEMCRRALPFTPDDARAVFALCADLQAHSVHWVRYKSLAKAVARAAEAGGWLASLRPDLEQLRDVLARSRSAQSAECRKLVKELDLLAAQAAGQPASAFRIEHDAWGEKAIAALEAMERDERSRWQALLAYCAAAKGAAPSARWLKAGEEAIAPLGKERFAALACEWLGLLRGPGPKKDATPEEQREFILGEANGDALKGLAWLLAHVPDEAVAGALGDAAVGAFRKIPNSGARSVKVGNACLHTLKSLPGLLGARQLAVLRAAVKLPSQAAAVEKALAECSERLQMSPHETEELATPDHGFANGARTVKFGEVAAGLTVDGTSVAVRWRSAEGKAQKTEPAQVKRDFPAERKALKRLIDDVEKALAALRDRLERQALDAREWPVDAWRERYIEHPIAGALARRLIWRFRGAGGERSAAWIGDQWRDESGGIVDIAGTTVLPWHPVFATAASVRNWRALLAAHGVEQPFKQAHREIYLLTDAERNTRTYSNRFAAHVLRQHQFASLCAARGWKYRLQGGFDSHNVPVLSLPQWRISAEYWVDAPGDAADLAPSGIYLHVLTDQVRFLPLGAEPGARAEPLPLEDIPPLVFSEVMRDVDLFVGVASVGNDPTWHDGGPGGHFRDYWQSYSFGELSVLAESRREILAEVLPRLTALREVARIDGRFLLVKGTRREYKIHLGSGNILMSPNDQYLCIVPDRSQRASDLRLPFEGDTLLGVILSKALLLARDDQIKDPTIVRQIEQGTR